MMPISKPLLALLVIVLCSDYFDYSQAVTTKKLTTTTKKLTTTTKKLTTTTKKLTTTTKKLTTTTKKLTTATLTKGITEEKNENWIEIKRINFTSEPLLVIISLPNGDIASGTWGPYDWLPWEPPFGYIDRAGLKVLDTIEGKEKFTLCKGWSCHRDGIYSLAILPTNGFLISGGWDTTIKIWNLENKSLVRTIYASDTMAAGIYPLISLLNGDIASALNGNWGNQDFTIKIWESNTGQLKFKLEGHTGYASSFTLLENGNLVSGSVDGTIKIWDSYNGTLKLKLTGHTKRIISLVTLKNGDLVSGSDDCTIKVWNVITGDLKTNFNIHNESVSSLVVLKNGDLASASLDSIKIWNVNDGIEKKNIKNGNSYVQLAALENGDLASSHAFYPIKGSDVIKIWRMQ